MQLLFHNEVKMYGQFAKKVQSKIYLRNIGFNTAIAFHRLKVLIEKKACMGMHTVFTKTMYRFAFINR